MKIKAKLKQYTIRSVSPPLDRALRRLAHKERKSINQLILDRLTQMVVGQTEPAPVHDLDSLIGSWQDDQLFDQVISAQSTVDEDLWR